MFVLGMTGFGMPSRFCLTAANGAVTAGGYAPKLGRSIAPSAFLKPDQLLSLVYARAEERSIDYPAQCGGNSWSFIEGCQSYAEEQSGNDEDGEEEYRGVTGRIYIANFGEGNALWPVAKANNTIITVDNVAVHGFWQAGDRDGFIEAAQTQSWTALGKRPSRQTAGRWFNLVTEMRDTEDDIWISRQSNDLWWTISLSGGLREQIKLSTNSARDGAEIWHIEKPCQPWSNRDRDGRPLTWDALHPKARDFLSTEATFQTISNDRGYADYASALVNGEPLDFWHALPLFKEKATLAKKQGGKTYSPKERAAYRMVDTLLKTVAQSNGQTVERTVKEKLSSLDKMEWERLLRLKMGEQEDRCALTGLPLGYDGETEDKELLASLDRVDSSGHYTPDNVQIVCRFINRWKGADDDMLVRRLLGTLRG